MKTTIPAAAAAAVAALLLALSGCTETATEKAADNPLLAAPVPAGMVRGTVAETMNAGDYTYVYVESDGQGFWIAGPETAVEIGDVVQASTGTPMSNFTSDSLGRTFDVVYFSAALQNLSAPAPAPVAQSHPAPAAIDPDAENIKLDPFEAGIDIAYVYANREALAGKQISLRGQVVKYNTNIMDMNFIHIRDGSGNAEEGNNDLTVTSMERTAVGDTIVVTGKILVDKDFGAGYTYPVMMDDATVLTESDEPNDESTD